MPDPIIRNVADVAKAVNTITEGWAPDDPRWKALAALVEYTERVGAGFIPSPPGSSTEER